MFLHDIKIAFRNLSKNKQFALINILGLTAGICLTLMMMMYVINEWNYENYHENKDSVYRLSLRWGDTENMRLFPGAMPALAPALAESVPDVINSVTVRPDYSAKISIGNQRFTEDNFFFVTENIFEMFTFDIEGSAAADMLDDPFELVISEKIAKKYFGDDEPVGKVISYGDYNLRVTGTYKNYPANTHFYPEFLLSYASVKSMGREIKLPWNNWGQDFPYIQVGAKADIEKIESAAKRLIVEHSGEHFENRCEIELIPIKDIHWRTDFNFDIGDKGNINYVLLFLSSSLLILLIAGFNFINLTTAKSFERMKEVGIRKVVGASKFQLIRQFLYESIILTTTALVLSLVFFETLSAALYNFIGVEIEFNQGNIILFSVFVVAAFIITTIVIGLFPAVYISRFNPSDSLGQRLFKISKENVRRVLVTIQFAITMFLVCSTLIILQQISFLKDADLGLDRENQVLVHMWTEEGKFIDKYKLLREAFEANPDIINISAAYTLPGVRSNEWKDIKLKNDPERRLNIQCVSIDYNYVNTLGLELFSGRNFEKEMITDIQEGIIFNQAAVKELGIANPLGTEFLIPVSGGSKQMKLIGIVKDFHIKSLHNSIQPLMLYINPDNFLNMVVKIRDGRVAETVNFLEAKWDEIIPQAKFEFAFLEDEYLRLYEEEEVIAKILGGFSLIALLIAIFGMLGLASFIISRRSKEIGIRKVLGASAALITLLLSKDFLKLVVAGSVITIPIIYYAVNSWLDNFAYRININILPFLYSAGIILFLSLLTVLVQSLKVAFSNPIEALRDE